MEILFEILKILIFTFIGFVLAVLIIGGTRNDK